MKLGEGRARRAVREVIFVGFLANLVGGVVVLVFLQWLTVANTPTNRNVQVSVWVGLAYAVIITAFVYGHAAQRFAATIAWLGAGREPTPEERSATLAQPARLAGQFFMCWLGGAALFGFLDSAVFDSSPSRTVHIVATTLLGGLTSCMVFFLVIERRLRPVFALALSGTPPARSAAIGIRPRLILSWALGSGVVLADLLLLPLTREQDRPRLVGSVVFLAVSGLVAGLVLTVMAARSVADPIDKVRSGLRRVQAGDLDVIVTVDDGGEIGRLQSGFNEMVAGLRERVLLRELLDRHIGDEVARYAIEHGVGLRGEMRDVSALFVDVIGSTTIAQQRPATEVVDLLNELFRLVVRTVTAEGGWVNKFEGDAALCVFGAPDDQPDHAVRALRAARKLRDGLADWKASGGLDTAIGVSSGNTVAGNVGSEERYEYTVIGDAVNEAARLADVAKSMSQRVVASAATITAANGRAGTWVSAGSQTLRGRREATELFVPTAIHETGPRHWVLVGLMGAGKTTVGELLARRAGRVFVDNDVQLSTVTGHTAREVQNVDGPDALHELERRALAHALESQPPAVIAAAASVVDDPEARELLRRAGLVIWLTVDVDELARRVQTAGHRPLASNPTPQLRQQSAARTASFADVADVVVDAERDPTDIVDELVVELGNR